MNGSEQDLKDVITYADLASKGLSLEDNFADIYGTKYGKEVISISKFMKRKLSIVRV